MAGLAIDFDVSAIKFEIALGIVVELPDAPSIGVMTGVTFLSKRELMHIILFVACAAIECVYFVVRA